MTIERRRYERVKASLNVDWGPTEECILKGRITSLSLGGCFIQTGNDLKKDGTIFLRMWLPMESIISCKVRYTLSKIGSGIEFIELDQEQRNALQMLIEHYRTATTGTPQDHSG